MTEGPCSQPACSITSLSLGNQRRKTFRHDDDYRAYLDRLKKYRTQCQVRIYAYCLMPNHVHLLLETGSTPLAKFMQGVQQSYPQYFNRRYRKVGHLFQGRYKAIVCDRDKYLLTLVRYEQRVNYLERLTLSDSLRRGHR